MELQVVGASTSVRPKRMVVKKKKSSMLAEDTDLTPITNQLVWSTNEVFKNYMEMVGQSRQFHVYTSDKKSGITWQKYEFEMSALYECKTCRVGRMPKAWLVQNLPVHIRYRDYGK